MKMNNLNYSLNCLYSLEQKTNLYHLKNIYIFRYRYLESYQNEDFCNTITPSEGTEMLEFNQYQKFDKEPFIIYKYFECLKEKIDRCKNYPENSFTTFYQVFQCLQYRH